MTEKEKDSEAKPPKQSTNKYSRRINPPKVGIKEVEGWIVGRDKKVVPPNEVMKLAEIGCKDHEICTWFGIDEHTLTYNFRDQLDLGRTRLKVSLRRCQIALAQNGNAVMLIWLGKNILGQSDQPLDSEATAPLPWSDQNI